MSEQGWAVNVLVCTTIDEEQYVCRASAEQVAAWIRGDLTRPLALYLDDPKAKPIYINQNHILLIQEK